MIDNQPKKTKAFIAGVNLNDPNFDYYMTELRELALANNLDVVGQGSQKAENIVAGTYFGVGKLNQIKNMARELHAKVLVINDELSPTQIRNIEGMTKLKVLDRTELILEIFSNRARSRQAKLQVQLARLQYELPRLHPSENNLDQQRGSGGASGGFANRGSGETKLELNRRTIGKQISAIKKELKDISKQEEIKSARRNNSRLPQVALVGYTNAGKSTTMNELLNVFSDEVNKKQVFEKNMLFATLDTTVRKIHLPDKREFLLSDTVGFISKLPHNLVEAFHSTLEEVKFANLLLEVVDYSDEHYMDHMEVTRQTLKELGADEIPCIHVFNKCDIAKANGREDVPAELPHIGKDCIYMAAGQNIGLEELVQLISNHIYQDYVECTMLIPYTEGALVSYFNENATVKETEYEAEGTKITMSCLLKDLKKYKEYVIL